jgi:hypothetical protein
MTNGRSQHALRLFSLMLQSTALSITYMRIRTDATRQAHVTEQIASRVTIMLHYSYIHTEHVTDHYGVI